LERQSARRRGTYGRPSGRSDQRTLAAEQPRAIHPKTKRQFLDMMATAEWTWCHGRMNSARITISDADGRERPFCDADQVVLSAASAPWADIVKVERHLIPGGEISASAPKDFLVAQRLTAPEDIEHRVAGERWKRTLIGPGDLNVVAAGTEFSMRWKDPTEILTVTVDSAFVRNIATHVCGSDRIDVPHRCGLRDLQLHHIVAAFEAEIAEGCPGGSLFGESLATTLVIHLAKRYSVFQGALASGYRSGFPRARLRTVMDYIQTHLLDDTSLRELALVADLSPHHFAALFKASTGLPPHQYVLQQRVEVAKRLLSDHRYSLAEVAQEAGFPTQAHFTATFRRMTGTSPGKYRAGLS
jgi:AraC family transcriptional regulator